jgi:hypothetical protein
MTTSSERLSQCSLAATLFDGGVQMEREEDESVDRGLTQAEASLRFARTGGATREELQ